MIMVIVSLVAGWSAWSFSHYAIHRWWHKLIQNYDETTHHRFYVEGEFRHHDIYDHDPHDPARDTSLQYISFPRPMAIKAVFAGSILYALGSWLLGWPWPLAASLFFTACLGSMYLDDWVHRRFQHANTPQKSRLACWLYKYHRIHHDRHVCNYGFCTGIPWDLLMGSYVRPGSANPASTASTPSSAASLTAWTSSRGSAAVNPANPSNPTRTSKPLSSENATTTTTPSNSPTAGSSKQEYIRAIRRVLFLPAGGRRVG